MDTDHPFGSFRSGMATDQAQAYRAACLEVLRLSTLFHPETYCASRGPPPPGTDPLADFHDTGWTLGHWPHPYFDPAWYRDQNQDVAASGIDPLLHYVSYGEQEGRRPVPWFDPAWYRARYQVPDGTHALSHFLRHRAAGHSPIPEFDSAWYLARYPDVAAAGMDPLEHYKVTRFH
jgi:hypothetical protein